MEKPRFTSNHAHHFRRRYSRAIVYCRTVELKSTFYPHTFMKHIMRVFTILTIAASIALFHQGCATILSGTSDTITIDSRPSSAIFIVKLKMGDAEVLSGTTPAVISLERKYEYRISIKMPGYKDKTIFIDQQPNGWALANICCNLYIGGAIDYLTGALWRLSPTRVSVSMETAYLENGTSKLYATLYTRDNEGRLRMLRVPMERDLSSAASVQ
ncbi:MAG: hypothetical protein JNL32_08955 [Candidatus Kapabacteria bacterium]|nr:hypothetical protein [Candidatus Kapabacteria bacterium]